MQKTPATGQMAGNQERRAWLLSEVATVAKHPNPNLHFKGVDVRAQGMGFILPPKHTCNDPKRKDL